MPIEDRDGAHGQVLRGVCPKCEQITKGKTPAGAWISKCAHPGVQYQGRMMPGGKKTVPVIPDSVDRGDLSAMGGILEAGVRADEVAAAAVKLDPRHGAPFLARFDPGAVLRGLIPKDEPRDAPEPVAAAPAAVGDPLAFDARGALECIADAARALTGALVGAVRRIRELETAIVDASIDGARARQALEDAQNEIARLHQHVDELQQKLDEGEVRETLADDDCEEVADRDVKPENSEPSDDFDPAEVAF